jgi:hypothetical protein
MTAPLSRGHILGTYGLLGPAWPVDHLAWPCVPDHRRRALAQCLPAPPHRAVNVRENRSECRLAETISGEVRAAVAQRMRAVRAAPAQPVPALER